MLKSAEKNYSTTEKELLAVHDGLMHFRPYITGTRITIKTDHRPLLGILTTKKSPFGPRWSRRLFQLSEFDFAVEYIRGEKNVVPDALSRLVSAISVKFESLAEAQKYDKDVKRIKETDPNAAIERGIVVKSLRDGKKV